MKQPTHGRSKKTKIDLSGFVHDYMAGIVNQWSLVAPHANPGMLEIFRDRDAAPLRNIVPWAGEFAGKYLTSAVQVLRTTGDERLRKHIGKFVKILTSLQAEDGYLGPWPRKCRLKNKNSEGGRTWDTWGHYHVMLGLMLWHEETGDKESLKCVMKMADLICKTYKGKKRPGRMVDSGCTEMNLAPAHSLAMLYRITRKKKYLDMSLQIVAEFPAKGADGVQAGDYFREGLKNTNFWDTPKPRWESLHPIMALAELYWVTGNRDYRTSFENLWWSMLKGDRHNTGGFTSGEKATGNPYDLGPIETCCTIAWMAMSVEMLKITGSSIVADELEISTLNSVVGMHSSSGRWATYDTPMNGVRRASAHHIVFQARESTPELNCCSVNSTRGFGMISDWAAIQHEDGLALNWYGPSTITSQIKRGLTVTLRQETSYPLAGKVTLLVSPSKKSKFTIRLRIPYWSEKTRVRINGTKIDDVPPGQYLAMSRLWRKGDRVEIVFDMSLHFWVGEKQCKKTTSVYRGPLLLAYDARYNLHLAHAGKGKTLIMDNWKGVDSSLLPMPALDAAKMTMRKTTWHSWLPPLLLLSFKAKNGKDVYLCDYASAGEAGTPYISWLNIENPPAKVRFSGDNPLRSKR